MIVPPLTRLEVASGMLFGGRRKAPQLPDPGDRSPIVALEHAILPALQRPPCLVSFSGGRDSSVVLAAAAALARREGLAPPIPVTNVFSAAPDATETDWQEGVVRHLGLEEWVRLEHGDELDLVGPYAQRVLRRHGLLWPCNVHFHLPLLDAAEGGSLLTGVGGDELFVAARRPRSVAVLAGAVRPQARDVLRVGFALAPRAARRAVIAGREPITFVWLEPHARRAVTAATAAETAVEPRGLVDRMAWWQTLRYLAVGTAALELTAMDAGVRIVHPLLAPTVWAATARAAAPHGFAGRTEGMRCLFGELLPDAVLARRSKAQFNEIFWTGRARAFASAWNGTGVPHEWVNAEALAGHWRGEQPSAQSFTLLQAAWLESAVHRVEQTAHCILE